MFGKKVILLAASILAISLWGCSADFDAGNNQASGEAGTAVVDSSSVGAANCIGCHEILDLDRGTSVIADYLQSKHVIHNTHVSAADECALKCHDPFGDGRSLESFIEVDGPYDATLVYPTLVSLTGDNSLFIPENGLAAVTCETCHGTGGDHVNGAAIPYKTPDYNRCGQCHNSDFFHNDYHPEADSIVEKVIASPHVTGVQKTEARCSKCHSDEGAKLHKDRDPTDPFFDTAAPLAEASPVQCRTCHDAHTFHLLEAAGGGGSSEYNTCTNCHQPINAYHGNFGVSGPSGLYTNRIIYDSHFDDPATTDIEGYNLGPDSPDPYTGLYSGNFGIASKRPCRDCHDVHAADTTKNKQWASSAHGGHIAQVKADAESNGTAVDALTAAVDSTTGSDYPGDITTGDSWLHFDWKDPATVPTTSNLIQQGHVAETCQRCHTATGAKYYLEAMASGKVYDQTKNDYSHLTGNAKEMLYCWGCHANNSGELRNPGGVTLEYKDSSAPVILPDLGKSNVCITCHGGLGNTESYAFLTGTHSNPMTSDPGTEIVGATHDLAAAAIIYQATTKVGYEYYADTFYADKRYYAHKNLGLNNDSPETGSGPCATCHMSNQNHTMGVVAKDGSGTITALKSTACIACHTGGHGPALVVKDTVTKYDPDTDTPEIEPQTAAAAAAFLEHEAEGFREALEILNQALIIDKGLTYDEALDTYFSGTSWGDEGTFGAAHNYVLLLHEPGAFAHNRFYAKRLIFDSIDWLDGDNWDTTGADPVAGTDLDLNNLDGIINIDTYAKAAAWLGAADTEDLAAVPPVAVGDANRP